MPCKLCDEDRPLVRAHIYPEAFYTFEEHPVTGQRVPLATMSTDGRRVKPSWNGIYDGNILCRSCEDVFGPWDDYASLKLFFLSVLWRASVSTNDVFGGMTLGPYEEQVRQAIRTSNPGDQAFFPVLLFLNVAPPGAEAAANVIGSPARIRMKDACGWTLYMGRIQVSIKVDPKPIPKAWGHCALHPQRAMILPFQIAGTPLAKHLSDVVARNDAAMEKLWPFVKDRDS